MKEYGECTSAIRALSKTVDTVKNSDAFYLTARCTMVDAKGKTIEFDTHVAARPSADGYGRLTWVWGDGQGLAFSPKMFQSAKSALDHVEICVPDERYSLVENSIKVRRRVKRVIEYLDDYDADDAEKLITKHNEGFASYMRDR